MSEIHYNTNNKPQSHMSERDFILELMQSTVNEDLHYFYRGEFTQSLSHQILSLAEKNIDKDHISSKIKKRVFHIMVESIQNISRHQDEPYKPEETAIFGIQKRSEHYYITTGNVIENAKTESLCSKLDKINNLDQEELDAFYREVLSNGQLSSKGGAGLGLIEMARKSGNKLKYALKQISDLMSYFYLHSSINTITLSEAPEPPDDSVYSLKYMTDLHQFIIDNNVLLIYSTVFDQDSLLSLIQIMKNRGDTLNSRKKLISLMVEMLQNIIHHGDVDFDGIKGSKGIFYIAENNGCNELTTINYIANSSIEKLKAKIDYINSLSDEEREDYYNERLFDFRMTTNKEAGLGFIEMRIKSKNPLEYSFEKVDNDYSLFKYTIQLRNN
ncbi:MAG: SiaB family protein kinase [Bacteroidales bacterium]|nr:SiaB family protein kinase [Bacteroidales bacterium]